MHMEQGSVLYNALGLRYLIFIHTYSKWSARFVIVQPFCKFPTWLLVVKCAPAWDGATEYTASVKDPQVIQAMTVTDYSITVESFASTFLGEGGGYMPPCAPLGSVTY